MISTQINLFACANGSTCQNKYINLCSNVQGAILEITVSAPTCALQSVLYDPPKNSQRCVRLECPNKLSAENRLSDSERTRSSANKLEGRSLCGRASLALTLSFSLRVCPC